MAIKPEKNRTYYPKYTSNFVADCTLKKLKLGRDPHVDGPLLKIVKHQTEVDTNP